MIMKFPSKSDAEPPTLVPPTSTIMFTNGKGSLVTLSRTFPFKAPDCEKTNKLADRIMPRVKSNFLNIPYKFMLGYKMREFEAGKVINICF